MLLSEALKGIETLNNFTDREVSSVTSNSKECEENGIFCAISGRSFDGADFVDEALRNKAAVVISERKLSLKCAVLVKNARSAYAVVCKNMTGGSADRLRLVAVTGTNGKTSVATIISQILLNANINAGLISTIKASYNGISEALDKTTPDSFKLHSLFSDMEKAGVEAVSMEASSQALDQKRLDGITFEVGIFTNLTRDHLDYHSDMEDYFKAKKSLFEKASQAVINLDDSYGKRLCGEINIPFKTFSLVDESADFFADEIKMSAEGVSFILKHNDISSRVNFKIPGLYSVQNALAAVAASSLFGLSVETIVGGLSKIEGIKGRNEVVNSKSGVSVIIDYAHTPDGLKNIIESTRKYHKGKITVLFGCGGNRDREKRPLMGKIASELADRVIITTDNQRNESPKIIIEEIIRGVKKGSDFIALLDRKEAIRYAIMTAKKDEIIIVAGKGHELYQIIGNKKIYFDERRLIEGILKKSDKGE